MSRLFETLIEGVSCHRTAQYTILLHLVAISYIACTVLLRFSLFEAVEKAVIYQTRANNNKIQTVLFQIEN